MRYPGFIKRSAYIINKENIAHKWETIMPDSILKNPQLEGGPFYWEGGPVGVLLVHGLTATAVEVRLFAKRLHDLGYTVGGPLLPGHGTTPQDLNRSHWQDWVAASVKVYQQLANNCQKVILAGESAGAVIALYLAVQHPEAVAVLVYAPAIKLAISRLQEIELHLAAPFILSMPKGDIDREDHWQGYKVNPLKAALQLLAFQKEVLRCLPQMKQPLLVVQGRHDTTIHSTAGELVIKVAGSTIKEMHWMEQSTHVVLLDQELDEITQFSVDFITRALALRAG
jgi:carboxylesterase